MIDGKEFPSMSSGANSMSELIELIKATIDPDSIITSISLAGQELSDNDWRTPLSAHGNSVLEILTGSKEEYVSERVVMADQFVEKIKATFATAQQAFESGQSSEGSNSFKTAVEDLKAFIEWYATLFELAPSTLKVNTEELTQNVDNIRETCEQLLQQQMYQSWWAMSETLKTKLDPELESLRVFCLKLANKAEES